MSNNFLKVINNGSNIWEATQDVKANDFYEDAKTKGYNFMIRGEVFAVNQLTIVCNEMSNQYDKIIEDQNEYIIEIDEFNSNFETSLAEIEEKIRNILARISELQRKADNGTITDEEKEELKGLNEEYSNLVQERDNIINNGNTKYNELEEKRNAEGRSKEKIATDYGETAIEKGTPLANTEVKGGFFRKLFGTTGKSKKEAGERAVKAGNELLDRVQSSIETDGKIDALLKGKK